MEYQVTFFLLRVVVPVVLLAVFSWVWVKFIDKNK
jgi:hypothetical protein